MKRALVLGGGGFIGSHLVKRLRREGYHVRAVDLKRPDFSASEAHEFIIGDLRDPKVVDLVVEENVDEIYQLAADMGGAGYIFTGENDADVMHNSATINLNVAESVIDMLAREGYDPKMGARPLGRKIDQLLRVPLSKKILFERLENCTIQAVLVDDSVEFAVEKSATAVVDADGFIRVPE
jgi:NAD(P)-dependent dehydrogenase (short-subunit alcohol dehydrogenase family)